MTSNNALCVLVSYCLLVFLVQYDYGKTSNRHRGKVLHHCEPVAGYTLKLMDHLFLCTNVLTGFNFRFSYQFCECPPSIFLFLTDRQPRMNREAAF